MKLAKPLMAMVDGQNALVLDIGISGAYVEHHGELPDGSRFVLTFRWHGEDVEFVCEVVHSEVLRGGVGGVSTISHTGVRFISAVGESEGRLQDMMATFVGRILAAQKVNASGTTDGADGEVILAGLGEARRQRTGGFATYRYTKGLWQRKIGNSPHQPVDGFTVAAYEDEEELEVLCRAYESADEEGRRLIQLVAELSVLSVKKR
jgi:hypothetical protein